MKWDSLVDPGTWKGKPAAGIEKRSSRDTRLASRKRRSRLRNKVRFSSGKAPVPELRNGPLYIGLAYTFPGNARAFTVQRRLFLALIRSNDSPLGPCHRTNYPIHACPARPEPRLTTASRSLSYPAGTQQRNYVTKELMWSCYCRRASLERPASPEGRPSND